MTLEPVRAPRKLAARKLLPVASRGMIVAVLAVSSPFSWGQSPQPAAAPVALASAVHLRGDLAGDWQGTLEVGKSLRIVLQIAKTDKGWSGKMYSIDQGSFGLTASNLTLDGSTFKYAVDQIGGDYKGTLSADGNTITGTWTQGPNPLPLTLVRASKETAWEIPAPPPPAKNMAADANPSFDVATIKPNDSGATSLQGINVNGRNFATRASSLQDLISFAYDVQAKQIVGAPEWIGQDRYDIAAVPDQDGVPNPEQVKSMIRKLLADRFKLTFHHDQRELSAYVLTVGKGGEKLKPTAMTGPLPGIGMRPKPEGLMVMLNNASIPVFTGFLQSFVLDRPVVDRTELKNKFDFTVTFTPNDSEFNGHAPPLPAHTDTTEAAPDLFQALQLQLGLKLTAEKTQVDVLAIDHVEKPSAN
jgi:uncharacterized protein (TIGR03435 family)